jgi:dihydrofolate synthase/folylpolyglutamate synthase
MLGADRVTIAKEKVGIVKDGSTVVTAERAPDVLAVLEAAGPVARIGRDFDVLEDRVALGGRYLSLRATGQVYEGLFMPLHGAHQAVNAATALEAVGRFLPARDLAHEIVAGALGTARVPGRLETVRMEGEATSILLDVAHNPDGMSAAITSIIEAFAFERVIFVLGILRDKDHEGMLTEMARVESTVVATEARNARSVPAAELSNAAAARGIESEVVDGVEAAIERARALAGPKDLICITGSHYIVGEGRDVLLPSRTELTQTGERKS